jgi:hypothetical protein
VNFVAVTYLSMSMSMPLFSEFQWFTSGDSRPSNGYPSEVDIAFKLGTAMQALAELTWIRVTELIEEFVLIAGSRGIVTVRVGVACA